MKDKIIRYLKYAFGETILIVFGILIALSINNWNKERNERILEQKIIKEIESNLQFDLQELTSDISDMDSLNQSCKFIIGYIKTKQTPNHIFFQQVSKLRLAPHFDPNKSGYNLLSSKGLEIIVNDSLRKAISVLYENKYPYYQKYVQERIQYRLLYTVPQIERYFTTILNSDSIFNSEFRISKQDYEKLKQDISFIKMLTTISYENSLELEKAKDTKRYIENMLKQLKKSETPKR